MSSRMNRFIALLGALFALLGFFFPLYSSEILSPDLARGPLNQSFQATQSFFILLPVALQHDQIQIAQLLFSILSFVLYWMVLLLALCLFSLVASAYRHVSRRSREWSTRLAIIGLATILLLILCHTFTFVVNVLSFVQRRLLTPWETLQQVGNALFWRALTDFCQSSFLGIWLPLLGFLTILCMNWLLRDQKLLPADR
jgi:hypothetical protein